MILDRKRESLSKRRKGKEEEDKEENEEETRKEEKEANWIKRNVGHDDRMAKNTVDKGGRSMPDGIIDKGSQGMVSGF